MVVQYTQYVICFYLIYSSSTEGKECAFGDPIVRECFRQDFGNGFVLRHRSCECNKCDTKPFVACTGK